MVYNVNMIRCTNASGNVEDTFNQCKEYVNFETETFVVALAVKYFKIKDFETPPDQVIPPSVLNLDAKGKREWLHGHIKKVLQLYLMKEQTTRMSNLQEQVTALVDRPAPVRVYSYRAENCDKVYWYEKARNNHEIRAHHIEVQLTPVETMLEVPATEPEERDDMYNYACARLNLGLLLRNVDDTVKEGDGERIIRCWRFFLLYYKASGRHKYALATFLLISNVTAVLSEQKSHRLIWNRTINTKGGAGKNISCDIRLEQWNRVTKELLSHLGLNLNEICAQRESNAIAFINDILKAIDEDLMLQQPTGKHMIKKKEADLQTLVNEFIRQDIFTFTPGRFYGCFEKFDTNLSAEMDVCTLANWLKQ